VQPEEPVFTWCVPAAQLVQTLAPEAVYLPWSQLAQFVEAAEPWNMPAAQLEHTEAPEAE